MDFYKKYLKYKSKYILLKSLIDKQTGGGKPLINNPHIINLFTDPDMERFLNPIYGYIMCEIGYISNNYYLHMHKFINTTESKIINKMCKIIPDGIQPTNDIMILDPIDFGRYIAFKYINMKNNIITTNINKPGKYIFTSKLNNNEIDKTILTNYIQKLHKFIPLIDNNDEIFFHFILYCFWWNAESEDGIKKYYNGINEVFSIMNKYVPVKYTLVDFTTVLPSNFEKIIAELLKKPFKIYNQEWSNNFCLVNNTYPDCGETTARNLINLICFDGNKFDINILKKYKPLPELIKYYEIFNNFNLQSDYKQMIYEQELNARDAWSYLIIKYAYSNVKFIKYCPDDITIQFEMDAGLSIDKKTGNFMQLIKNLLGIDKWDDLVNKYIISIDDNTRNGIGEIVIEHDLLKNVNIYCERGHYYMENIRKKPTSIELNGVSEENKKYINYILQKNINSDNYLYYNFNSNELEQNIKTAQNFELNTVLVKLFELSLTDKYDSDLRRRIIIDTEKILFHTIITNKQIQLNEKLNEYTYSSGDLTFIKQLQNLKYLNFELKDARKIETIDLKPLLESNVTSIGDYFLNHCIALKSIDLSGLSNITSIGNNFIYNCFALKEINLSGLSNVTTIGNEFLSYCSKLEKIDLSGLSNVTSIGGNFLSNCSTLKEIDLSGLSNVTSIGGNFLSYCSNLEKIDLSGLSNVSSIGNDFLSNCSNLEKIDLSGLSNVSSIGNNFIVRCFTLKEINLSGLSNVSSIGNDFLSQCSKLEKIDLSGLSNVSSIGDYFLARCFTLKEIDLSVLLNVTSIGGNFLSYCSKLEKIDLSGLSNVSSIGDNFLSDCSTLKEIDLSVLLNVTTIGNNFLSKCSALKEIDLSVLLNVTSIGDYFCASFTTLGKINLSGLSNVTTIGNNFLSKCSALKEIDLSGLSNVTSIGDYFCASCTTLEKIDLSGLLNVTSIGDYFCASCTTLKTIDLSGLSNVTSIGDYFCANCTTLEKIDLSGLSNVTTIGKYFMYYCSDLQSINLSGLTNIKSIGSDIFKYSTNLKNITLKYKSDIVKKSIKSYLKKNKQVDVLYID